MWHQLYPLDGPKTPQWMLPLSHLVSSCSLLWIRNESHVKNPILLSQGFHHRNFSHTRFSPTGVTEKSSVTSFSGVNLSLTCNLPEHRGQAATSQCPSRKLLRAFISAEVAAGSETVSSGCEKQCLLCSDETISGTVLWKGWGKRRWPAIRTLWMSQFSSPEPVEVSISLPFLPTRLKTNPCAVINGIVSLLLRYVSM